MHSNLVQNVDTQSDLLNFSLRLNQQAQSLQPGRLRELPSKSQRSVRLESYWSQTTEKLHLTAENGAFIYLCTLNGPIH